MTPKEQTDFYVEQGYLLVEGLISPAQLQELKSELAKLAKGGYPSETLTPQPASLSDEAALENILCIHFPHFISPVIKRYTMHDGIVEVLGRVVGAHLSASMWDGGVKCMQSMFFAKAPGKPGQAWHQDEVYIPTRDRSLCGAWIAIDDATLDNGCLWVLPGSHRPGVLYPQRPHGRELEFDDAPESYGFDDSHALPVEAPAGSVVFFNGYLLHRSLKNTSSQHRRALVNHYMSMQSKLPWLFESQYGKVPGLSVATADNRLAHPVCGEDPYEYLGYETPKDMVYLRGYERG